MDPDLWTLPKPNANGRRQEVPPSSATCLRWLGYFRHALQPRSAGEAPHGVVEFILLYAERLGSLLDQGSREFRQCQIGESGLMGAKGAGSPSLRPKPRTADAGHRPTALRLVTRETPPGAAPQPPVRRKDRVSR